MNIILSKIAIVSGDAELAELISAHFRAPRVYVAVIGAPTIRLEEYGVFQNDCIRVTNAIKAHHPQLVLFVACSDKVADTIRESLPPIDFLDIKSYDITELSRLVGFREHAVDVEVSYLRPRHHRHIVAVEKGDGMALVIARNLATACGADVFLLPEVTREREKDIDDRLRRWANESGVSKDEARNEVLSFLTAQLGPLPAAKPESVTFITLGIPYGIYPFRCPTTHLVSFPLLGVSTLNGMVKSLNRARRSPAVVFIDPGSVEKSELKPLKEAFGKAGYLMRSATGANATAGQARELTELLPSDFIFYSTHCGEVRGRRITERFCDRHGKKHEISYDVVRNLSLTSTPGMIHVESLTRFLSLDGISWNDDAAKRRINAGEVMKDFIELERRRKGDPKQYDIIESIKSPPIKSSDSLQMHDFAYCPMLQNVGGYMHPVVFNNACSSWREFAIRYGCNGASVYIGTSLDVLDSIAYKVAVSFAGAGAIGKNAGYALFRAQKEFVPQLGYTPYLMHGYLFTTILPLPRSAPDPAMIVAKRILEALATYQAGWSDDAKAKHQMEATKNFLQNELTSLKHVRTVKK